MPIKTQNGSGGGSVNSAVNTLRSVMAQRFTNVPMASADTVHSNLSTGTKSTFHGVLKYLDAQGTFKGLFTRNVTVTISSVTVQV